MAILDLSGKRLGATGSRHEQLIYAQVLELAGHPELVGPALVFRVPPNFLNGRQISEGDFRRVSTHFGRERDYPSGM